MKRNRGFLTGLWLGLALALGQPALAQDAPPPSKGQLLYLPVYSHIYHGVLDRKGKPDNLLLSALVSIRNADSRRPIRISSARYYDTEGKLLREFVAAPRVIPAFGTLELFVEQNDTSGGSGANFAIAWEAETAVNPPVVEALHAFIQGPRSVVFITYARPMRPAD